MGSIVTRSRGLPKQGIRSLPFFAHYSGLKVQFCAPFTLHFFVNKGFQDPGGNYHRNVLICKRTPSSRISYPSRDNRTPNQEGSLHLHGLLEKT